VVVPHRDGGLVYLSRNNEDPSKSWSVPERFGNLRREYEGAALVQSHSGSLVNLEVAAVEGEELVLYRRPDGSTPTWSGPFPIIGGVRGAPALIQSRHGAREHLDIVVPHRESGLVHLSRCNDTGSMTWASAFRFGDGRQYRDAALIQDNVGSIGNLEVVARDDDGGLAQYWRREGSPWTWSAPLPLSAERSWTATEGIFSWTTAFLQADTHVTVRVQLKPDAGITADTLASLKTMWREAILADWSDRFDCVAPNGERRRFTFDLQWVSAHPHYVVRIQRGPARTDLATWDTLDGGAMVSHQFGHMLGLPDEHPDAACPGRSPVNTRTVMDDGTAVTARLLHNVSRFHCAHVPAARQACTEVFGQPRDVHHFERLDDRQQKRFRQLLERAGARKLSATEALDVSVVLAVSGGAPNERYQYCCEVRADGAVETRFVDALHYVTPAGVHRTNAPREAVAEVFAHLSRDEFIALPDMLARTTPDGLVAVISVTVNQATKLVRVPVFERGSDAAARLDARAVPLPVRDDLVVSRDAAPPVLLRLFEVLRKVQPEIRQV
jgi:hypothetical protein